MVERQETPPLPPSFSRMASENVGTCPATYVQQFASTCGETRSCGCRKPHLARRPGTMDQNERRYLPSDLRPTFGGCRAPLFGSCSEQVEHPAGWRLIPPRVGRFSIDLRAVRTLVGPDQIGLTFPQFALLIEILVPFTTALGRWTVQCPRPRTASTGAAGDGSDSRACLYCPRARMPEHGPLPTARSRLAPVGTPNS